MSELVGVRVESAYLRGATTLRVLLPSTLRPGAAARTLWVLPVEDGIGGAYGDGLEVMRACGVAERHGVVCVAPEFDSCPWYGSHATDPTIRHEEHLLRVLLPLVEQRFAVSRAAADRLLFGFSKSGWGAVSLLLRHPGVFGAACSWDAPLSFGVADFGQAGTGQHFGSAEQMGLHLPMLLATRAAPVLRGGAPRLTILGRDLWGEETAAFHRHLEVLGIPHRYDDGLRCPHRWERSWVEPAVERFVG